VRGGFNGRFNSNPSEARVVVDELRAFDEWAARNQRDDGRPWEAAVLTFYRGQEREMRNHLRRWANQHHAMRHFVRGPRQRPYLSIELCTVDRFQGHEADLVIITFASARPTSFLESPNRLNVALTRARYQRVIVGDRAAMQRARGSVLAVLAENEPWDRAVTGGAR
jgi:superfamily I DNA and/or RNA helicase